MSDLRQKPLEEWGLDDLQEIVDLAWAEDFEFEIKRALPLKKDARGWCQSGKLHPSERDGLAREIVAFSNHRGGLIVVGLEESDDTPKRAKALMPPIPKIYDLKDQLARSLSATIDPPIRSIKFHVIDTGENEGYLLIRVPQSMYAPHGFGQPPQCFVRERDESKPMTMRDIQSSYWETRTRIERIDDLRNEKSSAFKNMYRTQRTVGFRLTAIPELEIPLPLLHRRITSGDFLPPVGVQSKRIAAAAAEWPFWGREWSVDANCVRRRFESKSGVRCRGYWEIDVSGAVSVQMETNGDVGSSDSPLIHIGWIVSTLADLLALARVVAADAGLDESVWWVDGEAQSNPFGTTVMYGRAHTSEPNISAGTKFRPVQVMLSNEVVGAAHVDYALASMFQVPCLEEGRDLQSDYKANLRDLQID